MEPSKTIRRKINGRLLKVLSADEEEMATEDSIGTGWDDEDEPVPDEVEESNEDIALEASTEMGLVRHLDLSETS